MKATEIFKLFLKKGLDPYERRAFTTEIRIAIHTNNDVFTRPNWSYEIPIAPRELESVFVEKLIKGTRYTHNSLGRYGETSCCICLTSFMKYLLYYIPRIVGTAREKNKYLALADVEIPKEKGYKRYWESRLIKKWHDFLKEYVSNADVIFWSAENKNYFLKKGIEI